MSPSRKRSLASFRRNTTSRYSTASFACEMLESRRLLAAVNWTGAGDGVNWTDPANWSSNPALPGPADDVTINVAANPNIVISSGTQVIQSLINAELLTISGAATLNVTTAASSSANVTLNGGTLSGGTWTFSGGAGVVLGAAVNLITGATISGDLFFTVDNGRGQIAGGTTFANARMIGSGSAIGFAPGSTLSGNILFEGAGAGGRYVEMNGTAGTFTIGASGSIKTAAGFGGVGNIGVGFWFSGAMTLNNQGLISSQTSARTVNVAPSSMTNTGTAEAISGATLSLTATNWSSSGTLSATGGSTLTLGGAWSNSGALNLNASTLNLGGTFSTSGFNFPGFARTGGTVNLTGTMNNSAATLTLNNATGSWNLSGGTISGGQLSYADGQILNILAVTGNTLTNLTVNGDIAFPSDNSRAVMTGTTTFANARMIGSGSAIGFAPGSTLSGNILFEGAGAGGRYVEMNGTAGTFTIGASGSIKTAAGFGGVGNIGVGFWFSGVMTLSNAGMISSEVSGKAININSATTFNLSGTTQVLNNGIINVDGTGNATITASATATLTRVRQNTLTLEAPLTLASDGTDAATSVVQSLTLTGAGRLDLKNNTLIVNYSGSSPFETYKTLITSGYNGGAWNGPGINSSTAAATPQRAIGFAESSALFTVFPAAFAGQSVDNTSILVRYTRNGDADLNRVVNLSDFNRLAANFGQTGATWSQGNFNFDNNVNLADFNLLAANFGQTASPNMRETSPISPIRQSIFNGSDDELV